MNFKVTSYIGKLDSLFTLADTISDDEVKGHFAKYLCIRTSGLVEVFFKTQIEDYAVGTSPKPIVSFVNHKFKTFTNINTKKINDLFEMFSLEWQQRFNDEMSEEQKSALNSVISNRNNIAHGNADSISLTNAKEYYLKVKEVLVILDGIISKKKK